MRADWTCIETIGETARALEFVPIDLSWDCFFELLCRPIESFSSTFCCPSRSILVGPTSQRSHRTEHAMTLQFEVRCCLYCRMRLADCHFHHGSWEESRVVYERDLFFFYYLLYKRSCAFAHGLVQYFSFAHHRHDHRQMYSGVYVTVIAHLFCYSLTGDPHLWPTIEPSRLNRSSMWG
ncbi:hypothetical protein HanHA300_Chr00c0666g0798881 [Helianthus annuus]|nr:hypothetical protein HanHA300_Chr00c0666g0798881 [Helianthus annuus]